jgi:YHS domain-containing protein
MSETARLVPPRDSQQWEDSSDASQASTDEIASPSGRVHGAGVMPTPAKPAVAIQATWEEHKSSSTGQTYWFNPVTQVSTYEMPPELQGLPVLSDVSSLDEAEFARRVDDDFAHGDAAVDVEAGVAQTSGQLPPGWAAHVSHSTGQTYFFCAATGETTYEFPQLRREAGPAALSADLTIASPNTYDPSDATSDRGAARDAQQERLAQLSAPVAATPSDPPSEHHQDGTHTEQEPVHQHHRQQQPSQQQPPVNSTAYRAGKDYRGPQDDAAYWETQTSNAASFLGMCPVPSRP